MPPSRLRSVHNTGDNVPYSFRQVSGFFKVPYRLITNKGDETGPTVYSPCLRRLESLTIFGCNYKGSIFSPDIIETLSVDPAFWVRTQASRAKARCSTT